MNELELVEWARDEATLSARSTEFTRAKIVQLLNDQMRKVFNPLISNARAGYWLHTFTRQLGVGNPFVRLPARAVPAIEQCDISNDSGRTWIAFDEAIEAEAQDCAEEARMYSWPQFYTLRGSYIYLINPTRIDTCMLRVKTVVKSSQIVETQTAGLVTAVDHETRIITVNSMPVDRLNANATLSGTNIIDCIEPRGNFERSLLSASATVLSSSTLQVAEGFSVARVEPGDYVRFEGQTDWPQLPEEFHTLLGSIAAIPICRRRDLDTRAERLAAASSDELQRLKSYLLPRVRVDTHKPIQHAWR